MHEVGAWDALVDIVGTVEGFEQLGIDEIRARPVALGDGWEHAAHGVLPVPAPATAILLEGLPIGPNGPVRGEATTPTGAALLRALSDGPAPAHWRPERSGWGAGTRNPAGYPNALRLILAKAASEAGEVSVLAVDLEDNRFITAFLGRLDCRAHRIDYHSAGQAPLMHFHAAAGTFEWLDSASIAAFCLSGLGLSHSFHTAEKNDVLRRELRTRDVVCWSTR